MVHKGIVFTEFSRSMGSSHNTLEITRVGHAHDNRLELMLHARQNRTGHNEKLPRLRHHLLLLLKLLTNRRESPVLDGTLLEPFQDRDDVGPTTRTRPAVDGQPPAAALGAVELFQPGPGAKGQDVHRGPVFDARDAAAVELVLFLQHLLSSGPGHVQAGRAVEGGDLFPGLDQAFGHHDRVDAVERERGVVGAGAVEQADGRVEGSGYGHAGLVVLDLGRRTNPLEHLAPVHLRVLVVTKRESTEPGLQLRVDHRL